MRLRLSRDQWISAALALLWCALVLAKATTNEDAFITFRVIDNFIHGYGLRWNVVERVQVYTHPLWMLANIPLYALWPNAFHTGVAMGVACSFAAAYILLRLCPGNSSRLLLLALLMGARSITEYGTSGLENSLSHLLIAWLCWIFCHRGTLRYPAFWMALCGALALMNRLDLVFLFAPVVAVMLATKQVPLRLGQWLLGSVPLVLWTLFAIIYYGSPFPNTFYAKLGGTLSEDMRRGLTYFFIYVSNDPVGVALLLLAPALLVAEAAGLRKRNVQWAVVALAAGMIAHVYYVVYIGGDYMMGRFFTPASFAGACMLVLWLRRSHAHSQLYAACIMFAASGAILYAKARPPVDCWLERERCRKHFAYYIQDNWLATYGAHGLFDAEGNIREQPNSEWTLEGLAMRSHPGSMMTTTSVGQHGYYAGPDSIIIDRLGLTDMFLAHSPIERFIWAGHARRHIPQGYGASLKGDLTTMDPEVARYVAFAQSITQGPIWRWERFRNIWLLNRGWLNEELDYYYASMRNNP